MDDRTLKALIAEKVMGWRRMDFGGEPMIVPPEGDERCNWAAEWDEDGCPDWMPDYPNDIAAAWQVVEEMDALGWTCRMRNGDTPEWHVQFYNGEDSPDAEHDNPARAICLAALKAVGVKVEDTV